jgi:hypothetical protein
MSARLQSGPAPPDPVTPPVGRTPPAPPFDTPPVGSTPPAPAFAMPPAPPFDAPPAPPVPTGVVPRQFPNWHVSSAPQSLFWVHSVHTPSGILQSRPWGVHCLSDVQGALQCCPTHRRPGVVQSELVTHSTQ